MCDTEHLTRLRDAFHPLRKWMGERADCDRFRQRLRVVDRIGLSPRGNPLPTWRPQDTYAHGIHALLGIYDDTVAESETEPTVVTTARNVVGAYDLANEPAWRKSWREERDADDG